MRKILLIRHGQTDWNVENRIQGPTDVPLNPRGREQAKSLAEELRHSQIDHIYSSTLCRALETGLEIAKYHGLKVQTDSRLNEVSQGVWEGLRVAEARARYPELYGQWETDPTSVVPPQGESILDAFARVRAFWLDRVAPSHGVIVIVAHKVVNGLLKLLIEEGVAAEKKERLKGLWKRLPAAEIETFVVS
ncbi:MAG: histidine phosphatase family protein [bacterium]